VRVGNWWRANGKRPGCRWRARLSRLPFRQCSLPKEFKTVCGIAIPAGPECFSSRTQSRQHKRTAGGCVLREERGLRPASRNGFPRRASNENTSRQQATTLAVFK